MKVMNDKLGLQGGLRRTPNSSYTDFSNSASRLLTELFPLTLTFKTEMALFDVSVSLY